MAKQRLDTLLAERGLAGSRTSAAESVRAGRVRVGRDGPIATKPGQLVAEDTELLVTEPPRYVSRGGLKLERALERLAIDVAGLDCLDVGASTGGFTDCLLRRGAARVAAVDVGRGQLDWRLRNDPRVSAIEGVNARELEAGALPFVPDLATIDVSFISLAKVLPSVAEVLGRDGQVLALVKPQFELGRASVGKGGVVRDTASRRAALRLAADAAAEAGLSIRGFAPSGVPGPKGNRETFIWCGRVGAALADVDVAIDEVDA
jgi:23S rRNA (cytidine1920-2'-O)/16S rRNA (cytidine1409-2'-O)-methyltransferase